MQATKKPLEQHPSNLVPSTYFPPGKRYDVRDSDSWVTVAKPLGIDPWDLIDFNFPGTKTTKAKDFQLACREVNWYLREYVGCDKATRDGQNWMFRSGIPKTQGAGVWKGGVIYLPASAVTRFKIRMLGGLSAGKTPASGDVLFFQIWDYTNGLTAFYIYVGGGASVSPMPLSVTMKGPWNHFTTTNPMSVTDFDVNASFATWGGGPWTRNFLTLFPSEGSRITIPMETGFTVGVGGGATSGEMIPKPDEALPFNGP